MQRLGIESEKAHLGFVVDKMALEQIFLRGVGLFFVSVIPPIRRFSSFVYCTANASVTHLKITFVCNSIPNLCVYINLRYLFLCHIQANPYEFRGPS